MLKGALIVIIGMLSTAYAAIVITHKNILGAESSLSKNRMY